MLGNAAQRKYELDGAWKETLAGEDNEGRRIMIFGTDDNLSKLCNLSTMFCDPGTFYSCPGLFSQLYTIHGSVDGTVFPLVFALLPNKTETTYQEERNVLKEEDIGKLTHVWHNLSTGSKMDLSMFMNMLIPHPVCSIWNDS
ncbi:hypothetical protein KUTeg_002340 [Tegillarca granosa]|uniref:Uncharacterized protein n=1 Tax=Tegillarca granosa TaxID=220873 RepID=A0ABQ9FU23_TEGGR|nr:hypothetical protein KUTeg_002340 [Tegillarca granosa]